MFYGCLFILPLIVILLVAIYILSLFSRFATLLGAIVVWIWDSFANLFRSDADKKPTVNPFKAFSMDDADFDEYRSQTYTSNNGPYSTADGSASTPKLFDKNDGEYVDFEEVNE